MFESGLVSVSFRGLTPEEIIKQTARNGLSCIEWGGDVHLPPADIRRAYGIALQTNTAGLRVSSYGSYFRIGITPIGQFADVLATAVALGAKLLRVWAYDSYLPSCSGAIWEELVKQGTIMAQMADDAGIRVCLECHNHTLTEDYHGALKFLQAVNHPGLRMYWQPNEKRDFDYNMRALKALAPYIECLHVFHWKEHHHYSLAEGREEWRAYLSVVQASSPKKLLPLLLEFMPDNRVESLPTEADILRQLIDEVSR